MTLTPLPVRSPARFFTGLLAVAALLPSQLTAQASASERSTLLQTISGTEIEVDYARPSVRGRSPIFGGIVHWEEVWTPGANDATTFRFSRDVTLNGLEVPAGRYSIWIQPLQSGDWTLMLHADTTLFHIPHPSLDEAFSTVAVKPTLGTEFVETLTWDLDAVRVDGALLQMRWGMNRVSIEMGVDPGYDFTVAAAEAARYVGSWTFDESMSIPPEAMVATWKEGMTENELVELDMWLDGLKEPREIRVVYDAEQEHLYVFDAVTAAMVRTSPDKPAMLLMEDAEGIFSQALLMDGEVAFVGGGGPVWEFEYGPDGNAMGFVARRPNDDIAARGTRSH